MNAGFACRDTDNIYDCSIYGNSFFFHPISLYSAHIKR